MIPVKPIDPEDLPLYAMQLLPPEEMEELTSQLQHSVQARKMLAEIYSDLSILAHTAEMHEPTALARQQFMKNVAREKKIIPRDPMEHYAATPIDSYAPRGGSSLFDDEPVHRSAGQRVLPWLGWALAAGIGAFAFVEYQQAVELKQTVAADHVQLRQTTEQAEAANVLLETMKNPTAVHVELTGANVKPQPTGRVTYVADKGSLIFLASNLEPLQPYKTYELWLIPADGHDPIPAGVFKPDEHGNASVVLPELQKGVEAKAFGVTIEDGDGSSAPTLPIILKGQPA